MEKMQRTSSKGFNKAIFAMSIFRGMSQVSTVPTEVVPWILVHQQRENEEDATPDHLIPLSFSTPDLVGCSRPYLKAWPNYDHNLMHERVGEPRRNELGHRQSIKYSRFKKAADMAKELNKKYSNYHEPSMSLQFLSGVYKNHGM